MQRFQWWKLRPAHEELLKEQPGDEMFSHFVPILRSNDYRTILAYVPSKTTIIVRNPLLLQYSVSWFHPAQNRTTAEEPVTLEALLSLTPPEDVDMVMILKSLPTSGR